MKAKRLRGRGARPSCACCPSLVSNCSFSVFRSPFFIASLAESPVFHLFGRRLHRALPVVAAFAQDLLRRPLEVGGRVFGRERRQLVLVRHRLQLTRAGLPLLRRDRLLFRRRTWLPHFLL